MPTFIYLMNFTDQGVKNIKDAPQRKEAAQKMISDLGGTMVSTYLTTGEFDRILIVDFPEGGAAAKFALGMGATGNVRTTTMRGFDEDEAMEIISGSP
ncbi:MAG: GYD domain-containing protein [Rhodospirillales bacterium]